MFRLGTIIARLKANKIGGSLYKQWGTWLNSTIHVKPYPCILRYNTASNVFCVIGYIGAAWLS